MKEPLLFPLKFQNNDMITKLMGEGLLERLSWLSFEPKKAWVIGAGVEDFHEELKQRYSDIKVITTHELSEQTFDLIMVNSALAFEASFSETCLNFIKHLNTNGVLMVAVFGIDTLKDWQSKLILRPGFIDMHDLGDMLLALGLVDPVIDTDYVTFSYKNASQFLAELSAANLIYPEVHMTAEIPLLAQIEIIYAHAFKPQAKSATQGQEVSIPLDQIKRL